MSDFIFWLFSQIIYCSVFQVAFDKYFNKTLFLFSVGPLLPLNITSICLDINGYSLAERLEAALNVVRSSVLCFLLHHGMWEQNQFVQSDSQVVQQWATRGSECELNTDSADDCFKNWATAVLLWSWCIWELKSARGRCGFVSVKLMSPISLRGSQFEDMLVGQRWRLSIVLCVHTQVFGGTVYLQLSLWEISKSSRKGRGAWEDLHSASRVVLLCWDFKDCAFS